MSLLNDLMIAVIGISDLSLAVVFGALVGVISNKVYDENFSDGETERKIDFIYRHIKNEQLRNDGVD